jgi:hypothetical protein
METDSHRNDDSDAESYYGFASEGVPGMRGRRTEDEASGTFLPEGWHEKRAVFLAAHKGESK